MSRVHTFVYDGFVALPIVIVALVASAARSWRLALAMFGWMLVAAALSLSGTLGRFSSMPPPIAVLLVTGLLATVAVGLSPWVVRLVALPLATLIVAQTFRILVEVLIHESSTIGLAPRQMTWQGYNFDIVTGITALVLAPFARAVPMSLVVAWNCLGLTLLLWVVGIAAVSFPTPFQLLRPDSTWLTLFPYVWLPSVLVTAALLGHVVIFRKLGAMRRSATQMI